MRLNILGLLFTAWCVGVTAVNTQKPIIVTFPAETPQSFIDKAMDTLKQAGGVVTHEYSLIKGFAAKASESTIEAVKALGGEFLPRIEDDQVVSTDGSIMNAF